MGQPEFKIIDFLVEDYSGKSKFLHILSFVFMAIPLFNLIVVNEQAVMRSSFVYATDRNMESIIGRGAWRCYVFQTSILLTGILLLISGWPGIEALWQNRVILFMMLLLFLLMGLLYYVHFGLQPKIEAIMSEIKPDMPGSDDFGARLKPYRTRRKRLATFCLFILITIIILGMQLYGTFSPLMTIGLIALAAIFAWRDDKTLVRFGWI